MTLAEFKAIYTKITLSDTQIQMYLDLFVCQYGEDDGDCCMYDHLQGLFTAHRCTVFQNASKGGGGAPTLTQTSKSVGDVSVSGHVSGANDSTFGDFGATAYGIEFINSIQLLGSGPMMAGC